MSHLWRKFEDELPPVDVQVEVSLDGKERTFTGTFLTGNGNDYVAAIGSDKLWWRYPIAQEPVP